MGNVGISQPHAAPSSAKTYLESCASGEIMPSTTSAALISALSFSEVLSPGANLYGYTDVHRISPTTRKDVTPLNRKPGGLMEQTNASLQRGDQG